MSVVSRDKRDISIVSDTLYDIILLWSAVQGRPTLPDPLTITTNNVIDPSDLYNFIESHTSLLEKSTSLKFPRDILKF